MKTNLGRTRRSLFGLGIAVLLFGWTPAAVAGTAPGFVVISTPELLPRLAQKPGVTAIGFVTTNLTFDELAGPDARYVQAWEESAPGKRAAYLGTEATDSTSKNPVRARLSTLATTRASWQQASSFIWIRETGSGLMVQVFVKDVDHRKLPSMLRVVLMPLRREFFVTRRN